MNKAPKKERNRGMYEALLTMQTVDEMMKFFDDLCTVTEIVAMEQRFQVAVCLSKGMIYNDILNGGYDMAFERLGITEEEN